MKKKKFPKHYLYEIYRDNVLWLTVTTWRSVIDNIFEDFKKTCGTCEYSFRQLSFYGGA